MSADNITQIAAAIRRSIDAPAGGIAERQIRAAMRDVARRCAEIASAKVEEMSDLCNMIGVSVADDIMLSIRREFGLEAAQPEGEKGGSRG